MSAGKMIALALVAIAAVFGFGVLAWKWKSGATSIVLAALPLATLFVVLPIPPAVFGMIKGFQNISQTGTAGIVLVAGLSRDVSRPLFWGSIAFIVMMAAAAALQKFAGEPEMDDAVTPPEPVAG